MITFLYTWFYAKKIKEFIQNQNFSLTSDEITMLIDKKRYLYSKQNICQLADNIFLLIWELSTLILSFANVLPFMMVILLQVILPFIIMRKSDNTCQKMLLEIKNISELAVN